jgi:CRP/FNR family transcriptional regulator
MRSVRDVLRQVPFLQDLPEGVLDEIGSACRERIFLRNEPLFLEGDPPRGLLVVRAGAVKIFKMGDAGREQILELEGPGRSVAELPLFDGLPYPASAAAVEDAVVLEIPVAEFDRLLARHPELTRAVIASLASRLRRLVGLVRELSLKDVRGRLLEFLRETSGGQSTFELGLSHQEIAARIGTVREIVSRLFGRLAKEGVLQVEGRTVTILRGDGI